MKLKIDDVEYEIKVLSLELSPFTVRLKELLQKVPCSFEEAEETSKEIKQLREKILAETVNPQPKPEHSIQLYNAVNKLTKEVMEKAGLFRQNKRSNPKKSSSTGAVTSQTPERNSKT